MAESKKLKFGRDFMWIPQDVRGKKWQDFCDWVNQGCDGDRHIDKRLDGLYTIGKDKRPNHITEWGRGYDQAVTDVFRRLNIDTTRRKRGRK